MHAYVHMRLQEGDEWRHVRTLLNPAFHKILLKNYSEVSLRASAGQRNRTVRVCVCVYFVAAAQLMRCCSAMLVLHR